MTAVGYTVVSSQMSVVGHDDTTNVLTIAFKSDKSGLAAIYDYSNVDSDLFSDLMNAPSKGSFFIANIKNKSDQYPCAKTDISDPNDVFDQIVDCSKFPFTGTIVAKLKSVKGFYKLANFSAPSWCW